MRNRDLGTVHDYNKVICLTLNLEADDAAIDKTVTNTECLSLFHHLEKDFRNQPPLSAKVSHFEAKKLTSRKLLLVLSFCSSSQR